MKDDNQTLDNEQGLSDSSHSNKFLTELLEEVSNPLHKRLLQAYRESDPVNSMENELGKILLEVLGHED